MKRLILFALLLVAVLSVTVHADPALKVNLTDVADAYVITSETWGYYRDYNAGLANRLYLQSNPDYTYRSYLRFDFSGAPSGVNITGANIKIAGASFSGAQETHHVYDDTWAEGTCSWCNASGQPFTQNITWNNQPCGNASYDNSTGLNTTNCNITYENNVGVGDGWNTLDVTNAVKQDYADGHNFASFMMIVPNESSHLDWSNIYLASRESGGVYLEVAYEPPTSCINITHDDWVVTYNATVCRGTYYLNDTNNNGVVLLNSPNINFDCNNSVFIGNNSGKLFNNGNNLLGSSGFSGVNISNCDIRNYSYGVYGGSLTSGGVINGYNYFTNGTLRNAPFVAWIYNFNGNRVYDSGIVNIYGVSNVNNNYLNNSGFYLGMNAYPQPNMNVQFDNNSIYYSPSYGVYFWEPYTLGFSNDVIRYSNDYGFSVENTDGLSWGASVNDTITDNRGGGILCYGDQRACPSNFYNSTVTNNGGWNVNFQAIDQSSNWYNVTYGNFTDSSYYGQGVNAYYYYDANSSSCIGAFKNANFTMQGDFSELTNSNGLTGVHLVRAWFDSPSGRVYATKNISVTSNNASFLNYSGQSNVTGNMRGNVHVVYVKAPSISGIVSSPLSPAVGTDYYIFNATLSGVPSSCMGSVILDFAGANYTATKSGGNYFVAFDYLPQNINGYQYRWVGSNSDGFSNFTGYQLYAVSTETGYMMQGVGLGLGNFLDFLWSPLAMFLIFISFAMIFATMIYYIGQYIQETGQ
jgi:hypothetical protein